MRIDWSVVIVETLFYVLISTVLIAAAIEMGWMALPLVIVVILMMRISQIANFKLQQDDQSREIGIWRSYGDDLDDDYDHF